MKALWLLLCLLLLSPAARAADALVLLSPSNAKPVVNPELYLHGEWILWPPSAGPASPNQLLSLTTGMDWDAKPNDLAFEEKDGWLRLTSYQRLVKRGYFLAREKVADSLQTFSISTRIKSPSAYFLGMDGRAPLTRPLSMTDAWPKEGLLLAEADGFDEVAAIAKRTSGRVLVVEYPVPPGGRWSHAWFLGSGWPDGLPVFSGLKVPGLIPASQAASLVIHPSATRWVESDIGNWGGANRWLRYVQTVGPFVAAVLMLLSVFFFGAGVYTALNEGRATLAAGVLRFLCLAPAWILLSGQLTALSGLSSSTASMIMAGVAIVAAAVGVGVACRLLVPSSHRLFPVTFVGLIATLASPPLWTLYSNVFGPSPQPVSPEALGALWCYMVAVVAFARGERYAEWLALGLVSAITVWGIASRPWWTENCWPLTALPVFAWIVGTGRLRRWMLGLVALWPLVDGRVVLHGIVFMPGNLFQSSSQSEALNLAATAEFLSSPGLVTTLAIGGAMALFGGKFLLHQLRRTARKEERLKPILQASAVALALGLLQPLMLEAALMALVGGLFALLADTVGPAEPALA